MPVHDWTKVTAGTFHHFHTAWITHLSESLNGGLLPEGYYALAEQRAENVGPDVLTLEASDSRSGPEEWSTDRPPGATAVAEKPPQVSYTESTEATVYAAKRRTLVIRHVTGDRIVAFVEILSPGNKQGQKALDVFLDKAVSALEGGLHLLIVDLFPPGPADPVGIHAALWSRIGHPRYRPPDEKPLTLAAYEAGPVVTAYVEPIAVASVLPPMPLFLQRGWYVETPLEETYTAAWRGMPDRWRRVVEQDEP